MEVIQVVIPSQYLEDITFKNKVCVTHAGQKIISEASILYKIYRQVETILLQVYIFWFKHCDTKLDQIQIYWDKFIYWSCSFTNLKYNWWNYAISWEEWWVDKKTAAI